MTAIVDPAPAHTPAFHYVPTARYLIHWRIAKIDPRFKLESDQVLKAAERAIRLWEAEAGLRLFVYDKIGGLPITLIFDSRQETMVAKHHAKVELGTAGIAVDEAERAEQDAANRFKFSQARFDTESQAFESKLNAYNRRVDYWNAQGGAPPEVVQALDAERSQLDTERLSLLQLQQDLESIRIDANKQAEAYEELVTRYNLSIQVFNRRFGASNNLKLGECLISGTTAKSIRIYAFEDTNHLSIILAHEFGHALGLNHVKGSGSLMNAVESGGDFASELRLAEPDRIELRRVLGR